MTKEPAALCRSPSMSKEADKTVAVLLATYNGGQYLQEFLDSLCAQTFTDFCVYVRDDGSKDNTLDILVKYAHRLDIRFLHSDEHLGAFQSFFRLLVESGNDHLYYMLADQDDYWYEDKIERACRALVGSFDKNVLYCTRLEYVDEALQHLGFSPIPRVVDFRNAVVENIATGCTIAISRRVKLDLSVPDKGDNFAHDWWLYMHCAAFGNIIFDPQPSIKYRQHQTNTIGAATKRIDLLVRRVKRFVQGEKIFSHQTRAFLACYGKRLSMPHRILIEDLLSSATTFSGRIKIAMNPKITRQTWFDNVAFRTIYLLGRF
ncbi:MAG: glycosyltransferase family 2 protein [Rhodocyclaceae bacterium]|nr:glycosyltransferase family 2 protein [Rhodocyclaceae bacterium]